MVRHDGTVESARRIVSELVGRRIRVVLDIQRQLVDDKKILYDTDAGQALQSELIEERKRSEAKIAELELDMKDALNDKDESWQKRIAEETSKLEADVAKKVAEGEEMKINMQKMIEEREETLRKMTEKMDQDRQHFSEELQKSTTRFQAFEEEQRQKQIQHQKEMREAEARNDKAEEERRKREWEKDQREANRHAAAMKKQADDHAREMAKIDLEKRKRSIGNPARWFGHKYRS
jgi:Fe2+ transport system protein B